MKKVIHTSSAPEPIGPYSQAIEFEDTLYVSGQIPVDPFTGEVVAGDIEEATEQVMNNLKAILEEAHFTFHDIVKTSIFVTDLSKFESVNEVYGSFFDHNRPPARETIEVSALPKGVEVEISCIAKKK